MPDKGFEEHVTKAQAAAAAETKKEPLPPEGKPEVALEASRRVVVAEGSRTRTFSPVS